MTALAIVGYALQGLAALTAWRVAGVRFAHRSVARWLALCAAADPLREAIGRWVLRPARAAIGPESLYSGWTRVAFHADQALLLLGPEGLAVVALGAFVRAPARGDVIGCAALFCVALAVAYPGLRGAPLGYAYAVLFAAAQVVAWGSAVLWLRRHPGGWPDTTGKIALALAAADLALWGVAFPSNTFAGWHLADGARCAILLWVVWVQVAWRRSIEA